MDLVARIYEHVENRDVYKAVHASLRLSRMIGDHMNTAMLLRELYTDSSEFARIIFDDTSHLKDEARSYLYKRSLERWLRSRTLSDSIDDESVVDEGDKRNILVISVADFQSDIEQSEGAIADMAIPPNMAAFDTAAFTERFVVSKSALRMRIRAVNTISSKILSFCLNFAIRIEGQLGAQRKTASFLAEAQNQVQNYFKAASEDVYEKLMKANQLLDSSSREDQALLLTEVRRAIKSVADHFFPPKQGLQKCRDGKERLLGDEQYTNRLHEYVFQTFERSTSTELLRAEATHLLAFAERLNAIASKGVHPPVSG